MEKVIERKRTIDLLDSLSPESIVLGKKKILVDESMYKCEVDGAEEPRSFFMDWMTLRNMKAGVVVKDGVGSHGWIKVGDLVLFRSDSGMIINLGRIQYRIIDPDRDVVLLKRKEINEN